MEKVNIGIIGCGAISPAYFKGMSFFDILNIKACADINHAAAEAKAEEYSIKAVSIDEILSDPEIDIILNLTVPKAHAEVSVAALNHNKHVYSEKPLAVSLEDGQRIVKTAKEKGLLAGCAPDTVLGAGIQTSRKLIDDGWIGKPIAGTAFMMSHGPESWHPNPAFYYQTGGGPLFDMGPYYLTALITLLGPIESVSAVTSRAFEQRIATCEQHYGEILPVEVNTHCAATLKFKCGAVVTTVFSFDIWKHSHSRIEIYGTEGSMEVPDPNTFAGPVKVYRAGAVNWVETPISHIYSDNSRGIGLADMAYAVRTNRKHRCSAELALHVLEVMQAFDKSSESGKAFSISSSTEQPQPLPMGLIHGKLD